MGNLVGWRLLCYIYHMVEYIPRLIDKKLDLWMKTFGAVVVAGPKWTGKTMTCEQRAKSAFYFTPHYGEPDPLEIARLDSSYVFEGARPRLIDEWQVMPEVWDMVRSAVDSNRGEKGLYLLTGSSLPPQLKRDKNKIRHSGAGRIATLQMSTMTLLETGDSSGDVSLSSLFERAPVKGHMRKISLEEIIHFIIRGGWPGNLAIDDVSIIPKEYVNTIFSSELEKLDGPRVDHAKFRRFLHSLARNESTVCTNSVLAKDAGMEGRKLDDETVSNYLHVLESLHLLNDQEAFSPDFRSRVRLKIGSKRHFVDPSIPAAIIGASEKNLLGDLRYLGFLFESLVEHDLCIYMDSLGGKLFHYQDYENDEVDAVAVMDDGRYGLIEIKLGSKDAIDTAVSSLLKVAGKMERKPEFLAVVSGMASVPLRREDGVYIVPFTSLAP